MCNACKEGTNGPGCTLIWQCHDTINPWELAILYGLCSNWPRSSCIQLLHGRCTRMYTDCFTTYWKQHASDPVNFKFPMDVLQPGWITCHPKILVSTSTCGKVSLVLTALGSFFWGVACPIVIFLSVKAGAHGPRLRSGASRVVLSDRPQKMWNSCGGIIPYRIPSGNLT
jgi:hypothetical protein